jgi:3-phenylpropionate/cinnamic acid dioxygenase small subunit
VSRLAPDRATRRAVADFIHDEAALLDERDLDRWLTLFAPEGLLWVPSRPGDSDPQRHVSIIYDHLPQLRARVTRLLSGKETAQDPPSRTIRSVTNLRVSVPPSPAGELDVETVQVIYETRGLPTPLLVLPCRVRHRLRPTDDAGTGPEFTIVCKRIDLLEVHRHFENLAFLL